MIINKLLTDVNYTKASNRAIKYIVIHYVGAGGGAEDNCKYFKSVDRQSSAHYFVGHRGEVWQCVEDKDIAWHCGTIGAYKHKECRNYNSIGIELCCRKNAAGVWYFEKETVAAAVELTKILMQKYKISADKVLRHYDVTGKVCPAPYVYNNTEHKWGSFLDLIVKESKPMAKVDNTPDKYAKEAVEWAIKEGILKGDDNGDLKLHTNITRQDALVFMYRALKG